MPISQPFLYPYPAGKDFTAARRRFLWFGSGGLLHKGLDRVLEVFAALPDFELTVLGPIDREPEFERAFHRELYETPNIHTHGWIDVASPEFLALALRHLALVYPSCSEGQNGGAVTCMHAGLIPVLSRESGVDLAPEYGIELASCSLEEIRGRVLELALRPAEELQAMSRNAWEWARAASHPRAVFARLPAVAARDFDALPAGVGPAGARARRMTAGTTARWLYLSPHLDDAALSCGGQISRATRTGLAVDILTIFAGDEPGPLEPIASPLVERIYDLWQLPRGEIMATRRREDAAACRELAAGPLHWELQEAIHRRDPDRPEALYPSLERLFGAVAAPEEMLVVRLAERFAGLPGAGEYQRIVAPLGVGGHVDHRLVRAAAERAFGASLLYYEEFPYVVWKLFALRRAGIHGRSWEALREPLSEEDIAARIAAIACYASQVSPLFRTPARIERLVRRHVRQARGERLWRRRPDRPPARGR